MSFVVNLILSHGDRESKYLFSLFLFLHSVRHPCLNLKEMLCAFTDGDKLKN